jgi:hypothetical protein
VRALGTILGVVLALWAAPAWPHEEVLLVGRVEIVQPDRKLLVVSEGRGGQRRRLEINQETEVLVCRTRSDLTLLQPGALVRVSYMDRPAGPEALSILLLRPPGR